MAGPDWVDRYIGQAIRRRRRLLGNTQRELATQLGVSSQVWHKWESGYNRLSAARLWQVAGLLDADIDSLTPPYAEPQADADSREELRENRHTLTLLRDYQALDPVIRTAVANLVHAAAEDGWHT